MARKPDIRRSHKSKGPLLPKAVGLRDPLPADRDTDALLLDMRLRKIVETRLQEYETERKAALSPRRGNHALSWTIVIAIFAVAFIGMWWWINGGGS